MDQVTPILWRALRTFLQVVVGLLSAKGFGVDGGVLPTEFFPALVMSAQLAAAPAVMSVLQNLSEIVMGFEKAKSRG
jgi:hypothetical protein